MPIISAFRKLRQKDCEFKGSLEYTARSCLKEGRDRGREGGGERGREKRREGEEGGRIKNILAFKYSLKYSCFAKKYFVRVY
jgi:hypothetical protein